MRWLVGKVGGYLEWRRELALYRDVSERLADWREITLPPSAELPGRQAGRCIDCSVPFCHEGCPLGNNIPDWNDLVYRGYWREAYVRLSATNNLPEITGRICPAPCETSCTLNIDQAPVTIRAVEMEIIERAFAEGHVLASPPKRRSGARVAVVGSGPAGLAAAAQLNSFGHRVVVYEAADRIGGLLRYGIPDFKLEKWVLDRRLELLAAEGVEFRTSVRVGETIRWEELREGSDAILLAVGAQRARDLSVPGRDRDGVVLAMDYLTQQNRVTAGELPKDPLLDAADRRVVILGGGDTGSDCLGTALRQRAAQVRQIELQPRPPVTRSGDNPWPQWPQTLHTTSSHEEGGQREFSLLTKRLSGKGRKLSTVNTVRVEARTSDGGRNQLVELPGTEKSISVDLLILAIGFLGPITDSLVDQLGVNLDPTGTVSSDGRYATNVDGVFVAGDANRGQSLVVWAIQEGRDAARCIDEWL